MAEPQHFQQKLSLVEKAGYSAADAAANFVFMSMILYQKNFYTDVFGLSAAAAGAILLWPRLWDAVVDPIVGTLADRTNTRWGKFRPWILFTAVPWCVVMILAYTTPLKWSTGALIAYAAVTNTLLMSIYSMNNMPYSALGGVMTGDINERAKLNSYRFVAVNVAQFIVGGFTLPLVAKFALAHAKKLDASATVTGLVDKYDTKLPDAPEAIAGYHLCASLLVAGLFVLCTILLICYPLGKRLTLQMADELALRRSANTGTASTAASS
jgi:Na+/melibiose symporter-like transporter